MKKRIIGLDLGEASCGWAYVELDSEKQEGRIIDAGAHLFTVAKVAKTGKSINLARRIARGTRRRLRRRGHRLERLKRFFVQNKMLGQEYLKEGKIRSDLFQRFYEETTKNGLNPYRLRFEGLERKLNTNEWIVVLTHCAKLRGFRSNSKREEIDSKSETGKMKKEITANQKIIEENKYRTVGEMFWKDSKFKEHKRNKSGNYTHSITRKMVKDELESLFKAQDDMGNKFTSIDFKERYLAIWGSQRHYDQGGNIVNMLGSCTFVSGEYRAPSMSYSAETFRLWQSINNLRYYGPGAKLYSLNEKQRKTLAAKAYEQEKITYTQLRTLLDIDDELKFKELRYPRKDRGNKSEQENDTKDKKVKNPESQVFIELKGWHSLRKLIQKRMGEEAWGKLNKEYETIDEISKALTYYKEDNRIKRELNENAPHLETDLIEVILELDYKKVVHLSFKALRNIIPHLRQGLSYDKACEQAGYDFQGFQRKDSNQEFKFLPVIPAKEIRNPVVLRGLSQSRKVLNTLIREYGSPDAIHIELLRDIAHSEKEKKEIEAGQERYRTRKEDNKAHFRECYNREPIGDELTKFILLNEQGNICAYSGECIKSERLPEKGYVEIDHILPYSRSLDNSMNNKVLCMGRENQNKGNMIPYEYLGGETAKRWLDFMKRVSALMHLRFPKEKRLLRESFTDEEAQEYRFSMVDRVESKWIAKFLKNFVEQNLLFGENASTKKVYTRNGELTSKLRHRWGLGHLKNRDTDNRHHALDAIIVACSTDGMVKRLSDWSARKERNEFAKEKIDFPIPWANFRKEVENYYHNNVFVSRLPRSKYSGGVHEDTIRSKKYVEYGFTVKRTNLKGLSITALDRLLNMSEEEKKILDKFGKNDKLYQTLKARLEEYGGKAQKAFAEPFYHSEYSDDTVIVRSIKTIDDSTTGVPVHGGVAANDNMIRVDVFQKERKSYLIPVYPHHRVLGRLPNQIIQAGKSEADWPEIDESYTFLFSLHLDDLIRIQRKRDKKPLLGYYRGTGRATASISLLEPNQPKADKKIESIGIQNLLIFEKLHVDVLGRFFLVKGEKRLELAKL